MDANFDRQGRGTVLMWRGKDRSCSSLQVSGSLDADRTSPPAASFELDIKLLGLIRAEVLHVQGRGRSRDGRSHGSRSGAGVTMKQIITARRVARHHRCDDVGRNRRWLQRQEGRVQRPRQLASSTTTTLRHGRTTAAASRRICNDGRKAHRGASRCRRSRSASAPPRSTRIS